MKVFCQNKQVERILSLVLSVVVLAFASEYLDAASASEPLMDNIWASSSNDIVALVGKCSLTDSRRIELRSCFANGEFRTDRTEEMLRCLASVFDLGMAPIAGTTSSGWIDHPVVVRLLAQTLQSTNGELRDRSSHYLAEYARDRDLRDNQAVILEAAGSKLFADRTRLLARLNLPKNQFANLVSNQKMPVEVEARMVGGEKVGQVIKSFFEAANYDDKRHFAEQLGFIGGAEAASALIAAVNSHLFSGGVYESQSVRVDIIKALGRINQDEPLLNQGLIQATVRGDGDGVEAGNYLKQILSWAHQQYGVQPTSELNAQADEPLLVKRYIIKRPLKRGSD